VGDKDPGGGDLGTLHPSLQEKKTFLGRKVKGGGKKKKKRGKGRRMTYLPAKTGETGEKFFFGKK